MNDPPKYVAPPPDPGLEILKAQNEQQQGIAIQDRVSADTARLMTMYGTRVAAGGNTNWSPLIAAPPMPTATRGQRTYSQDAGGMM